MPLFVDGEMIQYDFPTRAGVVGMLASVFVDGSKLELYDPAVYSGDGTRIYPGVRQMLEIARQIEALAAIEGFTSFAVTGKRLSGATPGRSVLLERKIRS